MCIICFCWLRQEYVAKQQRWLLFLRHCAKCQAAEGHCTYGQSCTVAKQLWRHILTCADPNCEYPRCAEHSWLWPLAPCFLFTCVLACIGRAVPQVLPCMMICAQLRHAWP